MGWDLVQPDLEMNEREIKLTALKGRNTNGLGLGPTRSKKGRNTNGLGHGPTPMSSAKVQNRILS